MAGFGLPGDCHGHLRIPGPSQQCKRRRAARAPLYESLFVLSVQTALRSGLMRARDLIIDRAPILAWRRTDPDAALGHAPAHHSRRLLRGYRVHTLLCHGSGLPVHFLVWPANGHDAPFACPLLEVAMRLYHLRPRVIRLDASYWGLRLIAWIHRTLGRWPSSRGIPSGRRIVGVCLPPGPKRNWVSAAASNC